MKVAAGPDASPLWKWVRGPDYALNQWEPLTAFPHDAELPIHSNLAEQEMKRQALNRKSRLFVGNERGGETSAVLSSLTSSCRRRAVDRRRT